MRAESISQNIQSIAVNGFNTTENDKVTDPSVFSNIIGDALNKVNESQVDANNKVESFIKGEDVTMHEVMISMQESQLSMQLLIEMRNKLVEAYQEVNKVQL
ncbi:MAG: flagellar hook-basal body complex protein FliE [Peptostreptococcaceae bacterium]